MKILLVVVAALAMLCGATLFGPSRVHAQQTVWLVQSHDQRSPWFSQAKVALEAEGVVVTQAAAEQPVCHTADCARERTRALGASRSALVRVEAAADRVTRVTVGIESVDGATGSASVQVFDRDVTSAVREAFRRAEIGLGLGDSGLLRVTTTPEAVLVTLDGSPIGHAPLQRRLPSGQHFVELSLDGFVGRAQHLTVERGRVHELVAKLTRVVERPGSVTVREASPLNYIVGAVLVVASVPALGSSTRTLALDGDCAGKQEGPGTCAERVHFGARSVGLFVLGAAALIGGAVVMVAAPFTIEVDAAPSAARVAVRGSF